MTPEFSAVARQVMQFAHEEAQRLNHEYIGTEHILLGLLKADRAVSLLTHFGLDPGTVRKEIEKSIGAALDPIFLETLPQTPRAKKAIEYATLEAYVLHHTKVGSEHLLIGLMREGEGVAGVVLRHLGLKLPELRKQLAGNRAPLIAIRSEGELSTSLPAEIQEKVHELDALIEQLGQEKKDAVNLSDFGRAADLRDRSDRLRKKRQEIIRAAQERLQEPPAADNQAGA
jgi:ATP-dependent Clp protease ATP-binding subunit ClpA